MKSNREKEVILEGLITGIFFGLFLKTGNSYDPNDIIISVLQKVEETTKSMPHVGNTPSFVPFASIIVTVLGILSLFVTILSVKNKKLGIILFIIGFICGVGLIMYAYH
ncbi:MAG: hypothetical protein WC593_07705 [Methanoregula sp.]